MRLYYISFFYYNIILFFFLLFKIDLLFFFFLFFRKSYSIYKESLTEYFFQDFDGLRKDYQALDLYENKLYVDFGLDVGLEETYTQNLYMNYSLYGINLDFEAYTGNFTFKWNDFNIEEFFFINMENKNFKKIYVSNFDKHLHLHYWFNLKEKMNTVISDDDYTHIYSYRYIHKKDFEDSSYSFENEKIYYDFLKVFFLKDNFYDTYIGDNYYNLLNYNNLINELKKKIKINRYKKNDNVIFFKESLASLQINVNDNINIELNK